MNRRPLVSGVIEGFYGHPWSPEQRERLLAWMNEAGLNTYLYAPKDDLKHRALWRDPYSEDELKSLGALARSCRTRDVTFVYAIAPGLDIRYREELPLLKAKLAQILALGVTTIAILFDDIPKTLSPEDEARFGSFARAQIHVTHEIQAWLRGLNPEAGLWFCPTIYCGRFAEHRVPENAYLLEIGAGLAPDIEMLWTGPEIIPEIISVESIQEVARVLRRPPLIWDNLHANDYDLRRIFLGPFAGRPIELHGVVRGVLSNPNCEFEANYIPLHTLGAYVNASGSWDVEAALDESCRRWLPSFRCQTRREFTFEDLRLLVDLYYLPFSAGPRLEQLIADFDHLIHHPVSEWGDTWVRFERTADAIAALFAKVTELEDRELCFTFYRLMWEIQAELKLMRGYLALLREPGSPERHYTPKVHHDPRIYRGGVVARLQRLMPMDGPGEFRAARSVPQTGN